jgi:branched-subunit amino acid aminotransferase/4-amino-4-deoxychorismate lyase
LSSPSAAGCVCVNGRFSAPGDAVVSALDTGFLLGDGLFESLRARKGVPYLLDRHLARLLSAAAAIELSGLPPVTALEEQVLETLARAALADAYVRITVTRGLGGPGLLAGAGPPTVVVAVLPVPSRARASKGIRVALLERDVEARAVAAKSTSWQKAVLDRRLVSRRDADEGIYVAADGRVLEGVSSNVFAVVGERLLTPPVRDCLPGITRARLLELAPHVGATVSETRIELEQLLRAEQVFVTNAVQGLRSVETIAGTAIGGRNSSTGVFAALRRRYEEDRSAVATPVPAPSG